MLSFTPKKVMDFIGRKRYQNQLYNLISTIFKDNSLITKILNNQRQYSDKDIFKNLIFK